MTELSREYGRRPKTLDQGAVATLRRYGWPGNVRELRNVIERLLIMVAGDVISAPAICRSSTARASSTPTATSADGQVLPLHDARERFERDYILRTLAAQQGNISRTADVLGVERSNLYRKMRAFGIAPGRRAGERADGARTSPAASRRFTSGSPTAGCPTGYPRRSSSTWWAWRSASGGTCGAAAASASRGDQADDLAVLDRACRVRRASHSTASKTTCIGVTRKSVRFIDTWARPRSRAGARSP